jgi:hypothetical protein
MDNKEIIKLLDNVYTLVMDKISNKDSNRVYRIPQVKNVLNLIDELQNEIEAL